MQNSRTFITSFMTRIIVGIHKTSGINCASAMTILNRIDKEDSLQGLHLPNQLNFRGPAVRADSARARLHAVS